MGGKLSYPARSCERVSRSPGLRAARTARKEDLCCARPDGKRTKYLTIPLTLMKGGRKEWGTVQDECAFGGYRILAIFEQFECRRLESNPCFFFRGARRSGTGKQTQ